MGVIGFLIALSLAFLSYFIAKSIKLPELAILLIIASLVGPNGFELVTMEEVEIFSSIGVMFLLYMIGLEFKTENLLFYGKRGLLFAVLKMTLVAIPISIMAYFLFNFSVFQALLLGAGLSITSTAIFSQVAKSFGVHKRPEAKQLFAELVWEDIFAIFLLLLVSSYGKESSIFVNIIVGLLYFAIPYFIVREISSVLVKKLPNDEEVYFLFSMAIAGVLVLVGELLNVSEELAAFLAGSIVANFKEIERIKQHLKILSSTFIIFFFFSLGMQGNLLVLLNPLLIGFILFVLLVNAIFKTFSTSFITLLFRGTPKQAAMSGLLMMSIGEFSLLLADKGREFFEGFDVFSFVSGLVLVSSVLAWYFPKLYPAYASYLIRVVNHSSSLFNVLRKKLVILKEDKKIFYAILFILAFPLSSLILNSALPLPLLLLATISLIFIATLRGKKRKNKSN